MFKNVLVATDLSPASASLLRCLAYLREVGAEKASLLHVMNVRDVGGLYLSLANLVRPILEAWEKTLAGQGFATSVEMKLGNPAYEINRFAVEKGYSLIVAATHGESIVQDVLIGSVVHRLLQIAEKPVLLVPVTILEGEEGAGRCETLCVDLFARILYATDFSDPAKRAFHYLEHICGRVKPEVTLFHAQDPGRIEPHLAHRIEEFNRIDRERLEELETRLSRWGIGGVHKEVEYGRPGPLLVEKTRKGNHTLLMIASQGRGYFAEAFLGRVANHVVHRSAIPVLVIPPQY